MVRTKLKFPEIAIHIFLADVNVCAGDGRLEEMPEALNAVDMMPRDRRAARPNPPVAQELMSSAS